MRDITYKELINTIAKDNFLNAMFLSYIRTSPLSKGRIVLDYGTGYGCGSYLLSLNAKSVDGFDTDVKKITFAKEIFRKKNLKFFSDPSLLLKDNNYDLICVFQVLQYVQFPYIAVSFLINNIKEGGIIKISIKNSYKKIQIILDNITTQNNIFVLLNKEIYPLSKEDNIIEYTFTKISGRDE